MRVAQLQSSWRVFELWNTDTGVKPKRGYIRGTPYVPFGTFGQTKVQVFQHRKLQITKISKHIGNVKICVVKKSPKSEIYAISNLFF